MGERALRGQAHLAEQALPEHEDHEPRGHAHCRGNALSKRTRRAFDPGREVHFGMSGRARSKLPKTLQLRHRHFESGQVKQRVKQHRRVTAGQDKPIAIRPSRSHGIEAHVVRPDLESDVRESHGCAGMSRVCLFDPIDG